ncbi:hypothetical protein ABBQ38_003783 [Trebouxia sp. C0009 RCD-2024]
MRVGFLLLCVLVHGHSPSSAQFLLSFPVAPAPAPAPEAVPSVLAEQPERPEVAAPIKPVSTPILTTLEPIVGDIMATAKTIAQDVRSGVDGFKEAAPGIKDSFQGRKLLTGGGNNRVKASQGRASVKQLQAQTDQQNGKAQGTATEADSQQQAFDGIGLQVGQEDENARIEQELAKMKDDRLKAIQALPSSVWH